MLEHEILNLIYTGNLITVSLGEKEFTYKCSFPVEEGDIVVLPRLGSSFKSNQFMLATVTSVSSEEEINPEINYRWAVAKISLDDYIELTRKDQELLKSIRKARKIAVKEQLLSSLVKDNPELKFLLTETAPLN